MTIRYRQGETGVNDGEREQIRLEGEQTDIDRLIRSLELRAMALSPQASNANQILSEETLAFLSSPQGAEFGHNLRFSICEQQAAAQDRTNELRAELIEIETELAATSRVFAFVEALVSKQERALRRAGAAKKD